MDRGTLRIREDVRGPAGQPGFLLIAPPNEKLDWDVEHEVASTCRQWMSEQQAWWIAAPYLTTAHEIVDRFSARPQPAWTRLASRLAPPFRGWFRRVTSVGYAVYGPSQHR